MSAPSCTSAAFTVGKRAKASTVGAAGRVVLQFVPVDLSLQPAYAGVSAVVAGMIAISKGKLHQLFSAGELSSVRSGRSRREPQRFLREYVDRLISEAA